MVVAKPDEVRKTLPVLKLTGEHELWRLGWEENWKELEDLLEPLDNGEFWVTSPEEDAFVDDVREEFDRSKNPGGSGIVHCMVSNFGGDDAGLLQRLLSLGVHPDLPDCMKWRPSHICGSWARPDFAEAIAACRPDVGAKNSYSHTPLEATQGTYTVNIHHIG